MRTFVSQDEEIKTMDKQQFYDVCLEAFRKGAELYTDGDENRIELRISKHQNNSFMLNVLVDGVDICDGLFVTQMAG